MKSLVPVCRVLMTAIASLVTSHCPSAQSLNTLFNFSSLPGFESGTNIGGAHPFHSLLLAGATLYGTTTYGGAVGGGTIFKVNTDGTGFQVVHDFLGYKNGDGVGPYCCLVLSGNTLYGTTAGGGPSLTESFGTIFAVNTDGTGYSILYAFDRSFAARGPGGGLVLSGNTLYGTTFATIFSINTDGTGYSTLHSASGTDGINPQGSLVLSGNKLFGTTYGGGSSSNGAVYTMFTDGTSYALLHSFSALTFLPDASTNSDGANPIAGLVLSGDTLFGTTPTGGPFGCGTLFSINTDGSGFKIVHSFIGTNEAAAPFEIALAGNTIYGGASFFPPDGAFNGKLFRVFNDGTGFAILQTLASGEFDVGGLVLSGNALYGVTEYGGSGGSGIVFKFSLLPQLAMTVLSDSSVLTWPAAQAGFTLQSSTNLASSIAWTAVSPEPVVVNGLNTVTNLISGAQQFFRLAQ